MDNKIDKKWSSFIASKVHSSAIHFIVINLVTQPSAVDHSCVLVACLSIGLSITLNK